MKIYVLTILLATCFIAANSFSMPADSSSPQIKGYELNNKYCVSCHDSVADPEKPGFTRDRWHVIIKLMHEYGLEDLTFEEKASLVDYFYTIRMGIEEEAG